MEHLKLPDKDPGPLPLGVLKNLLRRSVLINLSLIHIKDPRGHIPGKLHLMGHDHHGHTLPCQPADNGKHFAHHSRV